MARPKKSTNKNKTLDSINQIDGKNYKQKIKEIEELLGGGQGYNIYGTNSEEKLQQKLDDMTSYEVRKMAINVGVSASGNDLSIKERIKKKFKQDINFGSNISIVSNQGVKLDPQNAKHQEVLRYLRS